MIIKKEYTFDEAYTEFSHFEAIKMLNSLFEAYINVSETIEMCLQKEYDAYLFEAEKQLKLIEKNISVFQLGIMAHETKIFDKINLFGHIQIISNN